MHYGEGVGRQRRRRHGAEFKAEAANACQKPGMSMAAVALERSINANLLRRWMLEAERQERSESTENAPASAREAFIALPAPSQSHESLIQIEVRRGALSVIIDWPASAMPQCALWLRELLK